MLLNSINATDKLEADNLVRIGEDSLIRFLEATGFIIKNKKDVIESENDDYNILEISPRIKSVFLER
jgi:hypothetical protein